MVSPNIVKKIPIAIGIKPNQPTTFTNKTLDFGSGTGNVITNVPTSALQYNTISINGSAIPLGGNINLQVQGGDAIVDTDTTYSIKASSVTGGANLDLDAGGSGVGTDSVKFQGGGNVAVSRLDDNTILISDGGSLGGVAITDTSTNTLTNKTIDGGSNTLQNIPNIALQNSSITINGQQISLGGSVTIAGGGGGSSNPSAIETFTNKTMSGASNTFTNIDNSSLVNDSIFINGTEVELGGSLTVSGLGDVTTTGVQDLTNKSLLAPNISDARILAGLYLGSGSGTTGIAGQVIKSTGAGVQWANEDRTLAVALTIGPGLVSSSGNTNFDGSNGTTISVDTSTIANLTGAQTLTNKTLTAPNLTGDLKVNNVSGAAGQTIVSDGSGGLAWGSAASGGGGSFNGPITSTDNAILRYDGTTGDLAQDSLVTISDTGIITAPSVGSIIPFYHNSQFAFPAAGDCNGAVAISATDNAAFYASNGNWYQLAKQTDVTVSTRQTFSTGTFSLNLNGTSNQDLTGAYKSYLLFKIQTSHAAWVRVYTSSTARTADASRNIDVDPLPGSGVIAEVITTGSSTQVLTPAVIGFNDDSTPTDTIYLAITNRSGTNQAGFNVSLTALKLEA